MNVADGVDACLLSAGKLVVTAIAAMHTAMPVPLIMNSPRWPRRSIAKKEIKQQRDFQVRAHAARILERLMLTFWFDWKMVDA